MSFRGPQADPTPPTERSRGLEWPPLPSISNIQYSRQTSSK